MDRFDAMRAFARVAETGSFTQAARTLQLGRTRVTELVQQLEAHLQVRLLHRTTRRVALTPEGEVYFQRVLVLLADLEAAEVNLSSAASQARGCLRIDVPSPFARMLLVPALPAFHEQHPGIQLQVGVSDREVDLIGDNVDCVVRGGTPRGQSLVARPLGRLPFGVYASPSYLARTGVPAHAGELQHPPHRMVGLLGSNSGRLRVARLQRGDETVYVAADPRLAVDDGDAYLAAGVAGLGVICVPRYMAASDLSAGTLQVLLADWQLPSMPLHLQFPSNRHVSQRLRVFIDWLVGTMAGIEGVDPFAESI